MEREEFDKMLIVKFSLCSLCGRKVKISLVESETIILCYHTDPETGKACEGGGNMNKSLKNEASIFFREYQGYYEELLAEHPSRSKLRWWHILGMKPRGTIYQEVLDGCKAAIQDLEKNEIESAIGVLNLLIEWYEAEIERFSDSIWEMSNIDEIRATVSSMKYLKEKLLESRLVSPAYAGVNSIAPTNS